MALPASEENKELISSVSEMKGIVSGLLFQINENTLAAKESLAAIKVQQTQMAQGIGDLVAKAELDFEQMEDIGEAVKEPVQSEVVDATPELDQEVLDEIKDATKETADATTAIAASMSESNEDVLQATPESPTVDTDTTPTPTDATPDKVKTGGAGAIAIMLGAILGTIGGIVQGWAKALNLVLMGVPKRLAKIFKTFAGKVKSMFTFKANSGLSKGITRIKDFFKKMGNFFKGFGKKMGMFGNIFKTITSVASKVAIVVSKLAYPLTILLGLFEYIRGFI